MKQKVQRYKTLDDLVKNECTVEEMVRSSLHEMGWETGPSSTQIIPIMIGEEAETLAFAQWLADNQILAVAIRPPTVPDGASRIRLSLSALHDRTHIDRLIDVFQKWKFNK